MSETAEAIAGGAIASALLETLHNKGILDLEETRDILRRAMNEVGHMRTPASDVAGQIIGSLMRNKYPANR